MPLSTPPSTPSTPLSTPPSTPSTPSTLSTPPPNTPPPQTQTQTQTPSSTMPPGRIRRAGQFSATLSGILNSKSKSDAEARQNILRVYIPLLCGTFCLDVGCALSAIYIQCADLNDNFETTNLDWELEFDLERRPELGLEELGSGLELDSLSLNQCVLQQLLFNTNNTTSRSTLGDLFWLAVVRCIFTSLLLWFGVHFTKADRRQQQQGIDSENNDANDINNTREANGIEIENGNGMEAGMNERSATSTHNNSNNNRRRRRRQRFRNTNSNTNDTSSLSALTTPLLMKEEELMICPRVNGNGNGNDNNQVENQDDVFPDHPRNIHKEQGIQRDDENDVNNVNDENDNSKNNIFQLSETVAKNTTLFLLFISSTFFQVYAGVKVSTYQFHRDDDNDNDIDNDIDNDNHNHNNTGPNTHTDTTTNNNYINPAIPPLLCLSILWINAISYFFRVILEELSRKDALFLPPTVHRHPVFYEENRGINLHWCDICRRRIVSSNTTSSTNTNTSSSSSSNTHNTNNTNGGCYRCSLCDFDICIQCAKREDASTVGENLLRSDRGVREETMLNNTSYMQRSWTFLRPQCGILSGALVLLVGNSVTKLLLPHYQGKIIDRVIPNENGEYDRNGFVKYIEIYVIVMVVQGLVSTLYSSMLTLVSRRLKFMLRNSLFESILSQDVAYFDGTESGRLLSRLTNDLDLMMSPIQSSLSSLLNNILILIGGMVMCFIKSYRLSMLAFVTIGPITYLWNIYAGWSKGLAREMLAYWGEGNSIASQALSHIRTVKAFGCEKTVLEKYTEVNKEALDRGVKDAWGNGLTSALTGYLDLGAGILIMYFGGLLVFEGEMTVGDLVTFQLFWNMMNNSYQNLQGLITNFTRSAAGAEKVFSLYDSKPDINSTSGANISWDVKGDIELRNVKFYYQMRPDNIVLDEFNLKIPAGKTVALAGKSGGGKSTIINLLLRFYDVKSGSVLIDGREYPSLKVSQLRSLFGVVTQETELFSLTVEENIAYGLKKEEYSMEDLINAAKKAQAYEFIMDMKDGFQTRIGERGSRISGGQRQRLAIARVFLRKPRIILLDEATSALDENNQEAVQKALDILIAESNATVVVVAHRLSTILNADSIVVIEKGRAIEQGTHKELIEMGGEYASMVQKFELNEEQQINME